MNTFIGLLFFFGLQSNAAFAANENGAPDLPNNLQCLDQQHQAMNYNNNQVLQWEKSTSDQYLSRGLVQGKITQVYPNKNGHTHFALNLGAGGIEIIYNDEFGELPALQVGMTVSACGDYITVGPNARLPSPMPAILHWVHYNPGDRDGGRHPSGFLVIEGKAYGKPSSTRN
ncbi:MAG: hypothetical protein H7333_07970 [Bdellovibrionales bacterium]|nr:hypothetical protein [Oligoflexia bacterium]